MSTLHKWLIAIPFTALWALGLPALIAGRWGWFLSDLWDTVFVLLWAGTWAAGTHFYQPARHRRRPGRTRLVFSLSTLVVPLLAVYERTHGPAGGRSPVWAAAGLALFLLGAVLGMAAWRALGRWYAPDPNILPGQRLITSGPYRLVRHPM
ncbi:MAG: methyltransferase, partial [Armatimonadota bacterium]